jgi:hypothetical protein
MWHACGRRVSHIGYGWRSEKRRNQQKDIDVGERTILKLIYDIMERY